MNKNLMNLSMSIEHTTDCTERGADQCALFALSRNMCKGRSVQQMQVEEKPKTSKIRPLHAATVMSTPKHLGSCEGCTYLDNHSTVSSAVDRLSTGGVPSNGQAQKPKLLCVEAPRRISSSANYSGRQVEAGYRRLLAVYVVCKTQLTLRFCSRWSASGKCKNKVPSGQ